MDIDIWQLVQDFRGSCPLSRIASPENAVRDSTPEHAPFSPGTFSSICPDLDSDDLAPPATPATTHVRIAAGAMVQEVQLRRRQLPGQLWFSTGAQHAAVWRCDETSHPGRLSLREFGVLMYPVDSKEYEVPATSVSHHASPGSDAWRRLEDAPMTLKRNRCCMFYRPSAAVGNASARLQKTRSQEQTEGWGYFV